jgi:hypothetical protein
LDVLDGIILKSIVLSGLINAKVININNKYRPSIIGMYFTYSGFLMQNADAIG